MKRLAFYSMCFALVVAISAPKTLSQNLRNADASSVQNPSGSASRNNDPIPGRLSSDQMKAILAEADEENRRAFADLVQRTSVLPNSILSTIQQFRRTYPTSGIGKCEQETSELQARLGPLLTPKQVQDIVEMGQLLRLCEATMAGFGPPNPRNISASVSKAIDDEEHRKQQIENTRNAILQVEVALDNGNLNNANELFHELAGVPSVPAFAQSYIQQTQNIRQYLDKHVRPVTVSESPLLMNSLAQQTIEVVDSQPGLGNTWMVNARIPGEALTVVLLCSTDVADRYCVPLDPKQGKLSATLLEGEGAYKHYPTWVLQYPMANRPFSVYAIYKVRDSHGYFHEGRYPDQNGNEAQFAENGGDGLYLDMDHLQSQDKTDEQAACLGYIQKRDSSEYRRPDYLPVPKVDCYDHITYTHVKLTNPTGGEAAVRGIILRDNRSSSCGSAGCAISLLVQGCEDYPGNENNCKNSWSQGISTMGSNINVSTTPNRGWYDVVVTSAVKHSTYRYVGKSRYQDVVVIAREEQNAKNRAEERRSLALSLGLLSTQSQGDVKALLSAHGYHRLQDEPGQYGPWNCRSDGWKSGQWTTSCISQKRDVTIRLLFELGKMLRNADTGALQQVRTDRLLFASFEFAKYNFPDNTLILVSPALKKCHGEDDGDGVCFNF